MTHTGIASSSGFMRPFADNALMNAGLCSFSMILGAMPPPR